MQKPQGYDTVQAFGSFVPLELGGHICVVKKVEETKTRGTNKDMLVIYIDTHLTIIQIVIRMILGSLRNGL